MAIGVLLAMWSTVVRADDIPVIRLTNEGPSQELPTDKSFYLSGDAKDAITVQAVVIKKGSAWIGGNDGPSCADLSKQLHVDAPTPTRLDPGVHLAAAVFPAAEGDSRTDDVLVGSVWDSHIATDRSTYKSLITTDSTFFYPGYSFCVFVLQKAQRTASAETLVLPLVTKLGLCNQSDHPREPSTNSKQCFSEFSASYAAALKKYLFEIHVPSDEPDCTKPQQSTDEATDAVQSLSAAQVYCKTRSVLDGYIGTSTYALSIRDRAIASLRSPFAQIDVAAGFQSVTSDFGNALATALVRNGALFYTVTLTTHNKNVSRFILGGATPLEVAAVRVHDDDLTIEVASSVTPSVGHVLKGVTTKDLLVADGVTFYDVLLLCRHQVAGASVLNNEDLIDILAKFGAAGPPDARFDAVAKKLAAMMPLVSGDIGDEPPGNTQAYVGWRVHAWLKKSYPTLASGLSDLVRDFKILQQNKATLDKELPKLTAKIGTAFSLTGPSTLPMRMPLTEKTWAFSYLTPVVGYTQIYTPGGGWASFPYTAVELHFWPNPVDDPMWSHHDDRSYDYRRAVALEGGIALTSRDFGPDHRYRGIFGGPPIELGLAAHIIPYTSISFGMSLLERRSTVLSAENTGLFISMYFGLSVQANIPDLIKGQSIAVAGKTN